MALGKTKEAVDAAAGAIVSWGKRLEQRKAAVENLTRVLREAKDLPAYVASFEEALAKDKQENPTVRKALGRAFLERGDLAEAARHLEAAAESGPLDPETFRLLVEAYEKGGSKERAAERLLALARRSGRDRSLFKELGDRYEALNRAADAERAGTTLVELSANESEGHELLARVRVDQRRFDEAAGEWRQVIRIHSREPGGYLMLGDTLIRAGKAAEVREVLEKILRQDWPPQFGDTHKEARKLLDTIKG